MREQNSFNVCSSYITAIHIAILTWILTSCSSRTLLVTASSSVKSPGEMDPESLSILIGDNANITCRLSKPNSFDIWFIEEKSKRTIKQPSDLIQIIDQHTAVLMLHNAAEQNSRYQCKVGDYAIAETELYVGTKPLNVTDFSCINYDYEYMECNFTRPKNMILTRFDLEYKLAKDNVMHKCVCHDVGYHKMKCNVTDYLPMRETYLFSLRGKNDVGENLQKFTINNHKIVIPSATDIVKQGISSDSISLSLERLKFSYYIKIGLTYEIQIRDNSSSWKTPEKKKFDCQNGTCNITISDLYAFWLYWIKVRVKSNAIESDNYWSEESIISFRTKADRPKRPPETPLGSFYIDSTETKLQLYWEHMPKHEENGPDFHYVINEVNELGESTISSKTYESTATFAWKNESMQVFIVKSANDNGVSLNQHMIRVYRSGSSRNELNENSIAKVYHGGSYTLSWSPPENLADLINYTVFWCLPKIELPNQCKGPISYQYLDKYATNFTTEPKDRSLNLAISANYPNYNKGMQWARCSGDISSELMKMELELYALNESAILVKWNSGSVCASILKGYNLTFCLATLDEKCNSPTITVELLREKQEYRNYTISNLPPYTDVCATMLMYSTSRLGRRSDLYCARTKASAPSPPRNVVFFKHTITSKSAKIQWSSPEVSNGVLSHYTVYWRKYPDQAFERNTTSINQTSYELTGLHSYSNYEVYITAHTIEESVPSRRIKFTTLIGIPSGPRNLNIYENDTIIYWDQPDLPSGRHLFYVVALIRRDEKFNTVYERVSIVKGRSCRFRQPDCLKSNKSYALKVRAVNVGGIEEVDRDLVPMDKYLILAGAPLDEQFCESVNEENDNSNGIEANSIFQRDEDKFYFASPWTVAPRSYSCSVSSKTSIYAVAVVFVVAFSAYICCWLRNKYYKMKNIKVILPEGLVAQVSNYKFASNTLGDESNLGSPARKEFNPNISRSSDCLVAYGHKEHLNLITNLHNSSTNALSSISLNSSSTEHHNEEKLGEHRSLETTNEEISSNSSLASNSNNALEDHDRNKRLSPFEYTTIRVSSETEEEKTEKEDSKEDSPDGTNFNELSTQENNSYVTHNSQLLTSLLKATEKKVTPISQFNLTFPSMTDDGYIQPSAAKQLFQPSFSHHRQLPPATLNGYTCKESLHKLTSPPISHHEINTEISQNITNTKVPNKVTLNDENTPTPRASLNILSLQPSPVSSEQQRFSNEEHNRETKNINDAPALGSSPLQQPSDIGNTIYGYVTQQQLANFGTIVVLGK